MTNQQMPYVYLPIPISFETKRNWNKKGFRVMAIANMPEGYDNPADESKEPEAKPVQRKTKPR